MGAASVRLGELGLNTAPTPGWGGASAARGSDGPRTAARDGGGEAPPAGTAYPGRMDYWVAAFWTLLPTVVVSAIFFFVLRSIVRADRTERRVYAKIDAEERSKRGLPPRASTAAPTDS